MLAQRFLEKIEEDAPVRVSGRAVFMTGNPGRVPPALLHNLKVAETSFLLGRERFLAARRGGLPLWRERLFAFMSRNARGATTFFRIPPGRVVEIGEQIPL